jgi:hypothetical protein
MARETLKFEINIISKQTICVILGKVKFTLNEAMKAQEGKEEVQFYSFFNFGARCG